MTELLHPCKKGEYPTEYLLARLRGRKANLPERLDDIVRHDNPTDLLMNTQYGKFISVYSREGVRRRALKEFNWVYCQLNTDLAEIFKPFFLYLELRTLMICMRHRAGKTGMSAAGDSLMYSLLSDRVKRILTKEPDIPSILSCLEKTVLTPDFRSMRLSEIFLKEGSEAFEAKLAALVLEYIVFSGLHPVMKRFFTYLTDSRNIIAVYKHLRWNIPGKPVLAEGGQILKSVLTKTLKHGEMAGPISLAGRLAEIGIPAAETVNMEKIFLTALTKQVRAVGRSSDVGFILNYLWSVYIEAHNLGIILYGRGIERDILKEELVI